MLGSLAVVELPATVELPTAGGTSSEVEVVVGGGAATVLVVVEAMIGAAVCVKVTVVSTSSNALRVRT